MPDPLPIERLHHIAVVTRDPEKSKAFYRDVLGFQELQRPNFNFRGAWLAAYGLQIHIIENPRVAGEDAGPIDTRANHLAFAVRDAGPIVELLEQHGLPYHQQVNAGGIFQTFFQDPDGLHIEVAVYPPDPPPLQS